MRFALAITACLACTPLAAQTYTIEDVLREIGIIPPSAITTSPHTPRRAVPLPPRRPKHIGNAEPAVRASARAAGVPEDLAVKVGSSESGNTCSPGNPRYKGPLQVALATARSLGYRGNGADLNTCGMGLKYGMAHLATCFRLARGNPIKTIRCHRNGIGSISR